MRIGSLPTGSLPAQIIAADLSGDGWDDLVVRNAGDGTVSVYFNANDMTVAGRPFIGPKNPSELFAFAVPFPVSLGVSDVAAVDTTGDGRLDLVVTNKLTGQVSVLLNQGNGTFAPPAPYRAGTGLSAIDPGGTPEVASLEETAGVAGGPLTPGGPTDLVTINSGSNTLDVLAGLGGGRFANPVEINTASHAEVVRVADFNHDGIPELAVLTSDGVSIYLGNGKGGFLRPTSYAVPAESDGLTVADVNHDGNPDLLVGDAYGDVLVLLGNGDGTFQPYHEANQSVELAVADLTGNGSKDIIYADQGLDRVVVDYGAGNSTVLANQSTGLLDPGAVTLADLNGDGIPDLIVANSGSNNVRIYPGLGNGQFGPSVNGGHGFFTGTNPVGITVADLTGSLPDLVVANKGSNQVSILLNQGNFHFTAGPRLNSGGSGPVATIVGNFLGANQPPDILVTNSGSNVVVLLPGVGGGFFNDQNPKTFAVGADPVTSFVGNFDGKTDLVTPNAGSNDLTLISDFLSADPVTSTLSSGGTDPVAAFSFSSGSGFDNLVVGHSDGVLALFEGSSAGLSLTSTTTEPDLPSPTALVFAGLAGGQVQFYAATEGREAAALVALSLGGEISPLLAPGAPTEFAVAQLVPLQESSLALVGTLLIATVESQARQVHLGASESEAAAALSLSSEAPLAVGQGVAAQSLGDETGGAGDEQLAKPEEPAAGVPAPTAAPAWRRLILGTDEALERFDRQHPELFPAGGDEARETSPTGGQIEIRAPTHQDPPPGQSTSARAERRLEAIDRAIELLGDPDLVALEPSNGAERTAAAPWRPTVSTPGPTVGPMVPELSHRPGTVDVPAQQFRKSGQAPTLQNAERKLDLSASLALAATVAGAVCVHAADRRARKRPFLTGPRGWPAPRRGSRDAHAQAW